MKKLGLLLFLCLQLHFAQAKGAWFGYMLEEKEKSSSLVANKAELNSNQFKSNKQGFFASHDLVFFYASTCPHCHHFSPVLKAWAEKAQAEVLALSFDNQPLPEFPHFQEASTAWTTAAFAGQEITYPALFIVHKPSKNLYPVSIGALSSLELQGRMQDFMAKISSYEAAWGM